MPEHRQAFATPQSRLPGRPGGGRVFEAPGRRLPLLAMRPASRHNAILARGLENAVQPVTITRTGS